MLLRQQLRHQIRQKRRQLTTQQQQEAAQQLLQQCQNASCFSQAQHIALYLSNDGEIDTTPLIHWLWQQHKQVYLPVLHPFSKGHLLFLHYSPHSQLICNKYGISEPKLNIEHVIPTQQLDLIATPLVAFDQQGQRLGMGGGYYDRTLQHWHTHKEGPMPIGLAHHCQQVQALPSEIWDVPLPQIITPTQHHIW
ncbi:5-formyltetrahydrofolate cyclo-ligase [Photobacterium damselae]|uniref:5-formyltetrahydrofolate cyclo-ligase n=1 Tax=Photobacterium damselae TaxID=38293 RepID=A0ABD6X3T6_PHODM|nr:5-formyltetrahydrofolate cyclo-ligase [Photobacterium damselae]OBU45660.1 5-formyltetrahydrofolate cyclo-ligase [Photobacterium damselae]PSU17143.1 5-formyltetrahydrofolate cyclo-ligase [Photobacterium damselae]UKA06708.1 5-formyltetrahydrofolate cyclo-ligase [Photobacterium damselae subsp. damselae]UKA21812.1 5-formyltetrahydrofolate cyclo-ligase [Photobacterium damselae subsp. damselae]